MQSSPPTGLRRYLPDIGTPAYHLMLAVVAAAAIATTLIAMALQRNVAYLYTPSEVLRGEAGQHALPERDAEPGGHQGHGGTRGRNEGRR
mgnify:CR=1 FL=1